MFGDVHMTDSLSDEVKHGQDGVIIGGGSSLPRMKQKERGPHQLVKTVNPRLLLLDFVD